MSKRRFQEPVPFIDGNFWILRLWSNTPGTARKRLRIRLGPATLSLREAQKLADPHIKSVNRGLVLTGSGVNFQTFMEQTYIPAELPLLASGVQTTYRTMLTKHVLSIFRDSSLHDLSSVTLQRFFSAMPARGISHPTMIKVRDALSSILRSAVRFGFLEANPLEKVHFPPDKRGRVEKTVLSPIDFSRLIASLGEPYGTMAYVAAFTGLRCSELCALRWKNIGANSISIEQRYSKGESSRTKTPMSAAPIAVDRHVIERIERLKTLVISVRAGCATRSYRAVKDDAPQAIVFQSLTSAETPMNAANVLKRHFKPACAKLGLHGIDWRCLRRSCATWQIRAGCDPKSVQGQLRHTKITTTLQHYAQILSEGQREAATKLTEYVAFEKYGTDKTGPETVQ